MINPCGRCGEVTDFETREYCVYCLEDLCPDCWRLLGHCGHSELNGETARLIRAYTANKRDREVKTAVSGQLELFNEDS